MKALPSKYKSQSVEYTGGTSSTIKSSGGYLLLAEYSTQIGGIYRVKSKQTFNRIPTKVEIAYNPDNVTDVMIEGYYKSGNSKYYWLLMGFLLGIIPIIAYWMLES